MNDRGAVDALLEHVQQSLDRTLDADDLQRVRQNITGKFDQAQVLRQIRLQNSDEPDFVFQAHRKGE